MEENSQKPGWMITLRNLSEVIDRFRIFPRLFIGVYIYLVYESSMWFMSLEDPNTQQAGLISVITGVGGVWFGHYVNTKGDKQ